jgi:hypothetical protein
MKVRDTVSNHITLRHETRKKYDNVLLAAAMELGDSVSAEVIAASRAVAQSNLDAEHEFDAAILWLHQAERDFLAMHAKTEVEL